MRHSLAVFLLFTLTACSIFEPLPDGSAPTKQMPVEEIYSLAKEELNDGNYEAAVKLYETLQSRYPYGRYAQQALLETAYAYYRQSEAEMAISAAERFIKQYPNNPHVDYAYYVKGLANFNGEISLLGSLGGQDPTERDPKAAQDSFAAFKDLVARFPESKYAEDSAARMRYLVNSLAQNEVHVARYYMKRAAYVAAANRAQYAVQNYAQAPAIEEALFIMVKAYDALGMNELRDAADRVMRKNFPQSRSFAGKVGREVSWWKLWDPDW